MILGQLRVLRLEQCDIGTVETSETSTLCVETREMSVLAAEEMSGVETGQMSAVETRQMYSIETGQRPVATVDICLVSTCTSKDRKAR